MSVCNVACIQLNSGTDIQDNLNVAAKLISDAVREGAEFVVTPENTDFVRQSASLTLETALPADKHPGISFFSLLAKELQVWLLIGSMKIKISDDKVANRSFLFSDKGQLMATYDKIHMFDADLPNGETYRDSDTTKPGGQAVIASTPWKKLGMTICYDLRFPQLYRDLAKNGAEIMAVPSAFTAETGKAHWETLLRARAIETGSFVIAPAQVGGHEGGRRTHGHSMIIGPWGKILAEATDGNPGFITRQIDLVQTTKARVAIPSLQHDCQYELLKPKS